LRTTRHVPGKLFSVNAVTAAAVDGLFARNERVVCVWEATPQPFAMVLVGALFVGSISTVWHGEITPPTRPLARELAPVSGPGACLARGDLMGWFNMGSTVILLFPQGQVRWAPELAAGMAIRVGQVLGQVRAAE
jgi:phosphatidylserine decarboxylase